MFFRCMQGEAPLRSGDKELGIGEETEAMTSPRRRLEQSSWAEDLSEVLRDASTRGVVRNGHFARARPSWDLNDTDQEQDAWEAAIGSVLDDSLDNSTAKPGDSLDNTKCTNERARDIEKLLREREEEITELRIKVRDRDHALKLAQKQLQTEKLERREVQTNLEKARHEAARLRAELETAHSRIEALVLLGVDQQTQPPLSPSSFHFQEREETKSETNHSRPASPVNRPRPASTNISLRSQAPPPVDISLTQRTLIEATPPSSATSPLSSRFPKAQELTHERKEERPAPVDAVEDSQGTVPRVENSMSSFELLQEIRRQSNSKQHQISSLSYQKSPSPRSQKPSPRHDNHTPCDVSLPSAHSESPIHREWESELAAERSFHQHLLLNNKNRTDQRLINAWDEACISFRERLDILSQLDEIPNDARPLYIIDQLERLKRRLRSQPDSSKPIRLARQLESVFARERELSTDRSAAYLSQDERNRNALALSRERLRIERHVRAAIRNWQREHRQVFVYRGIPFLELLDMRHDEACENADRERRDARLRRLGYQSRSAASYGQLCTQNQ